MITVRTMKQIPTSRMIPGFRSVGSGNRSSSVSADRQRIASGCQQQQQHEAIRQWRNRVWQQRHLGTL